MTEEQRKEYERLIDKKYAIGGHSLTYDEEIQLRELEYIKEQDRKSEQEQLRISACEKIASAFGLTYDELEAFCDWIRR